MEMERLTPSFAFCSADRRREALSAAVVTSVGAAMANPLVAQVSMLCVWVVRNTS
jgi:hypothetical protein